MTEPPGAGGGARGAILVAAAAVLALAVLEVLGAMGTTGPWRQAAGVVLGVIAAVSVISAVRIVALDRAVSRGLLEELRASEQQAAGITSITIDAIITIDEQQRIIVFNHGAETTFGWSSDEVMGKPLTILLPDRVHEIHARHIARFGAGTEVARRMGQRQEIVGRRRDGSEFPAEASISRLDLPGRRLYTVVLRDITDRHRQLQDERFLAGAGETLSASLDYESTLVSAVHLAVPHLADCCVLDLCDDNGMTRRIASVHEDHDRTKALRALEHRNEPPSDWPFPVATVMDERSTVTINGDPAATPAGQSDPRPDIVARLGTRSLTSLPLVARGRLVGVLTLLTTDASRTLDSDRVSVAESVSRLLALSIDNAGLYQTAQRATVARDEILGAVSHDLRNPLAAISLCARALSSETNDKDRREIVGAIVESAGMMNHMIEDLLDVSTIDSGHFRVDPSPQEVEPLLNRVIEMTSGAANERHVEVRSALPPSLPTVNVDPTRFVQVLANLVGNAVKFTDSGGIVTISAQPNANHAVISVRDTGIGIPREHLPHIFDRHWHARRTARTAGTGLGLAIARGIVHAHGGRIWVDSTEGVGSTFSFTVPIALLATPDRPS
jgi:PAS domain S-box-containing protein